MSTQDRVEERYDERRGGVVQEVRNPDTTGDAYFHGPNPYREGFGTRGVEAEGGGVDHTVPSRAGRGDEPASGEPDESWTNAQLRAELDRRGVEYEHGANKPALLAAVRGE